MIQIKNANDLMKSGRREEALNTMRDALEPNARQPFRTPVALTEYGEMALLMGHADEASEAFRRAIEVKVTTSKHLPRVVSKTGSIAELRASAHFSCGNWGMNRGQGPSSGVEFSKAVELVPDWSAVRAYRAENLRRLNKRSESRKEFEVLAKDRDPEVAAFAAKQLESLRT